MKHHVLLICLLAACADEIGPPTNNGVDAGPVGDGGGSGDGPLVPNGKVTTVTNADGSSTTLVDATATADWTHVAIDSFGLVLEAESWQLRFQRFHISTGTDTEVAPVAMSFDAVTTAPTTGWLHDQDVDANGSIDYAFEQGDGWYDYNVDTHVLTPKPLTWVVRSPDTTLKLRIDKYYDGAGTSGWFTLTWRKL